MLRKVCQEAANWTRPYTVAVNISPIQFKLANLPELIHEILLETGMPANRLELEITESALIEDLQRTLDMLRRIKALGVAIAMDDFGTGYSSLSTLQAFPFDKLKIDKSFVDKIGSRQQATVIVTAVLGLGRSLDIPVLAEGVENELQRAFLSGEACAQAQGYLFGTAGAALRDPAPRLSARTPTRRREILGSAPCRTSRCCKRRRARRRLNRRDAGPVPHLVAEPGRLALGVAARFRLGLRRGVRKRHARREDAPRSSRTPIAFITGRSGSRSRREKRRDLVQRALLHHAIEALLDALGRASAAAGSTTNRARRFRRQQRRRRAHPLPFERCERPVRLEHFQRAQRCAADRSAGSPRRLPDRIARNRSCRNATPRFRQFAPPNCRANCGGNGGDGGEPLGQRLEIEAGSAGDDRPAHRPCPLHPAPAACRRARRRPNSGSPPDTWP